MIQQAGLTLRKVVGELEELAPLRFAEDWDNVGLLIEPVRPRRVTRILLTIDLTEPVMDEAIRQRAELIVAYHPILFEPVQRLTASQAMERVVLKAVEKRIAVYSPHTALDAAEGGVNDWLADGLGQGRRDVLALHPTANEADEESSSGDPFKILGPGRLVTLAKAVSLATLAARVKKHLRIKHVRLAKAVRSGPRPKQVQTVALCAGAGGSVLQGVKADVYLTGEMRHHDTLAATAAGTHVILSEHTHTERGYLPVLKRRLNRACDGEVEVFLSKADAEPVATA